MSLDAGNYEAPAIVDVVYGRDVANEIHTPWSDWEPSRIGHHGQACCEIAREWMVDTDYSSLNGADPLTGPRWLRHRFEWGPGTYPIHWCELIKKSRLDCGVLAALAHEVLVSRGVRCFRAQFVQEFSTTAAMQWRAAWEDENAVTAWIRDEMIYHEGCAVVARDNYLKLWDSSAGWWLDPKTTSGYGSLRAVRISAALGTDFRWGDHTISAGTWKALP